MRVLVLFDELEPGGGTTAAVGMTNGLRNAGIDTHFAAPRGPLRDRLDDGVRFHPLPRPSVGNVFRLTSSLRRIVRAVRPDIVHSHDGTLGALTGMLMHTTRRRVPVVVTRHSWFTRVPPYVGSLFFRMFCDRFILLTPAAAAHFRKGAVPAERVEVIPNFVDVAWVRTRVEPSIGESARRELGIDRNSVVVMTAARLVAEKRIGLFIDVLAEAASQSPHPIIGLIAGDGPDRAALEATAVRERAGRVIFLGHSDDVFRWMAASDIFMSLSDAPVEVMPMALIESAAAGKAIVCAATEPNRSIVRHRENGLLADDRADFVRHLLALANDSELRHRLGARAADMARRQFDRAPAIQRIIGLYREMLA